MNKKSSIKTIQKMNISFGYIEPWKRWICYFNYSIVTDSQRDWRNNGHRILLLTFHHVSLFMLIEMTHGSLANTSTCSLFLQVFYFWIKLIKLRHIFTLFPKVLTSLEKWLLVLKFFDYSVFVRYMQLNYCSRIEFVEDFSSFTNY